MFREKNLRRNRIILLLRPLSDTSIQAWAYSTTYLVANFGFRYIQTTNELKNLVEDIDFLVVPYSFGQLPNPEIRREFMERHDEAIRVRFLNEYNLTENSSFRGLRFDYLLTNFDAFDIRYNFGKIITANFNCIPYRGRKVSPARLYDLTYYGTFRAGREKYFSRYIDGRIILSTSKKNVVKYRTIIPSKNGVPRFILPMSVVDLLPQFKYSLYIEDEFTHSHYNFPANRFYECLDAGTVQYFDENCRHTFERYGLDIPSQFYVHDADDLWARIRTSTWAQSWEIQSGWRSFVEQDKISLKSTLTEFFDTASRLR